MTREEKIKIAMCENLSTKGNVVSGLTKSATAISQLFDEEMIEFAEWKDKCTFWHDGYWIHNHVKGFDENRVEPYDTTELLQIFKNI